MLIKTHRPLRAPLLLVVLAALAVLATATPASAATLTVTNGADSGVGSLRQTIAIASPGDAIDFGPSVTSITLTSGELAINKNLTISGPGAGSLTIDGNASSRIFNIGSGATVSISGLTITNGKVTSDTGGAILNSGTLTVSDSTISGSSAAPGFSSRGGGTYNDLGTLTLINSTVTGNTSSFFGGGISSAGGSVTLNGSTVSGNTASWFGGGIYSAGGSVTFNGSAISGNASNIHGGGIYSAGGSLTIDESTVGDNTANSHGAGIDTFGTLTITNSTVSGNGGGTFLGGGIYNGGTATVVNSTISGNLATLGGGFYNDTNGVATISNTTISSGSFSTSIYNQESAGIQASLSIRNSILASTGTECHGGSPVTSLGYNLSEDSSCGLAAAGDQENTGALLGSLQNNGGPTLTHALLAGSPAIDAGNPATPGSGGNACEATDQRGVARPVGPNCDIGAVEGTAEPPVVTHTLHVSVVGSGTVASAPAGIDCPGDCTQDYDFGAGVVLTATPAVGWSFTGWSGDGAGAGPGSRSVTMDADKSVTATFTINTHTLHVSVVGSGTVASAPAGIACPGDCTQDNDFGTGVVLTATPAAGWSFTGWSGAGAGAGPGTRTVTMDADKSVTATFTSFEDAAVATVNELRAALDTLEPTDLQGDSKSKNKARNNERWFSNRLTGVLGNIETGLFSDALADANNILGKVDGCGERGAPDPEDKILTCGGQAVADPLVRDLIGFLEELVP